MDRHFGCDPSKRETILAKRGFDLLAMDVVFTDPRRLDFADSRLDYGEQRRITIGIARGRAFTVVYTVRGQLIWLITAWPASRKERLRYEQR